MRGLPAVLAVGVLFALPLSGAGGEGLESLRLCNPSGGIRAERSPGGVQIRYTDGEGRPGRVDFALKGWEVRGAWAQGEGGCVEVAKPGGRGAGDVLGARDEVYQAGGPFQETVDLRSTQRVIELGGERIVIEGTEVVHPKREKKPR